MRLFHPPIDTRGEVRPAPGIRMLVRSGSTPISLQVQAKPMEIAFIVEADSPIEYVTPISLQGDSHVEKRVSPRSASEWLSENRDKLSRFANRWIAITAKGVIAKSDDFDEVYALAQERGVLNPMVIKVPPRHRGPKAVSAHSTR